MSPALPCISAPATQPGHVRQLAWQQHRNSRIAGRQAPELLGRAMRLEGLAKPVPSRPVQNLMRPEQATLPAEATKAAL